MDLNPRLLHGVNHLATTSPLKSTLQCEQGCRIFNSLILTAANRGAEFYSWILTIANRGAEYLTVWYWLLRIWCRIFYRLTLTAANSGAEYLTVWYWILRTVVLNISQFDTDSLSNRGAEYFIFWYSLNATNKGAEYSTYLTFWYSLHAANKGAEYSILHFDTRCMLRTWVPNILQFDTDCCKQGCQILYNLILTAGNRGAKYCTVWYSLPHQQHSRTFSVGRKDWMTKWGPNHLPHNHHPQPSLAP